MSARLYRIAGPVAVAVDLNAKMYDVVLVGKEELLGEVIQIAEEKTLIQVYEDTSGLKPGDPVKNTEQPLSVELGPGLLANVYDGIQRPLSDLRNTTGDFITRGAKLPGLNPKKKWLFQATAKNNTEVKPGNILGTVEEVAGFTHHILVPPGTSGKLTGLNSGEFTVNDPIAQVNGEDVFLKQRWPVRRPRPVEKTLPPNQPLVTGQRVIDTLFPVAKGGTAIIPGPFGAGKTVAQQALAKWSDADIIVYIGCGERGNEMTEVLTKFPELQDPRNGRPLMDRTVLIANTSNMPVAAREASIYTGITIAEYFRDMGLDVAVMADSTSRWAEALREISSRLEEMPGEEGFPAYLSSKIAAFYERAGAAKVLSGKKGSLTVIGAVSPPGGDFFEPVTQNSLRVAKVFWALDAKLAQQRQFPSINWLESYSLYPKVLAEWYSNEVGEDWIPMIEKISKTLQEENELLELVQLVGADALPEQQQLTLHVAQIMRETVLQQSAFDERDWYSSLEKSYALIRLVTKYAQYAEKALSSGKTFKEIIDHNLASKIYQCKNEKNTKDAVSNVMSEVKAL